MPFGDGTGPAGMGPMTGRGAGYCAGYQVPGFMNPIPGRLGFAGVAGGYPYTGGAPYGAAGYGPFAAGVAPFYGRGWGGGRGWGRGFGRGWGRGFGRGFGRGRALGWASGLSGYRW